jgi:hypothetical protein
MPKGPPARGTTQRDCRFDHVVTAAANQGTGKTASYRGIDTADRAKDIKQGVYRCARHRGLSASVEWLHSGRLTSKSDDWPPDREADGTYTLQITIYSKAQARKRHIAKYGANRENWPYDVRRPVSQTDIDAWAARGLDEKGHRKR